MSTIGHPLADLANLVFPYITANNATAQKLLSAAPTTGSSQKSFQPNATPGLPSLEQCVTWYGEVAGWQYTPAELAWGYGFSAYKLSVILQGIAARYAVRQASSAAAKEHASKMQPMGEVAWSLVEQAMDKSQTAKL